MMPLRHIKTTIRNEVIGLESFVVYIACTNWKKS
jgi:hypothetical protein